MSFGRNHMKRDAAGPVRWRQAVEPSGGSRVFELNMVRLWSAGRGARLGLESPSAGRRTHRLMRGEAERREGLRPAYACGVGSRLKRNRPRVVNSIGPLPFGLARIDGGSFGTARSGRSPSETKRYSAHRSGPRRPCRRPHVRAANVGERSVEILHLTARALCVEARAALIDGRAKRFDRCPCRRRDPAHRPSPFRAFPASASAAEARSSVARAEGERFAAAVCRPAAASGFGQARSVRPSASTA